MKAIYNASIIALIILLFYTKVTCSDDSTLSQETFSTFVMDQINTTQYQWSILDTLKSSSPISGDTSPLSDNSSVQQFSGATSSSYNASSVIMTRNSSTSSSLSSSSMMDISAETSSLLSNTKIDSNSSSSPPSSSFSGSLILDQLSLSSSSDSSPVSDLITSSSPSSSSESFILVQLSSSPLNSSSNLSSEIPSSSSSSSSLSSLSSKMDISTETSSLLLHSEIDSNSSSNSVSPPSSSSSGSLILDQLSLSSSSSDPSPVSDLITSSSSLSSSISPSESFILVQLSSSPLNSSSNLSSEISSSFSSSSSSSPPSSVSFSGSIILDQLSLSSSNATIASNFITSPSLNSSSNLLSEILQPSSPSSSSSSSPPSSLSSSSMRASTPVQGNPTFTRGVTFPPSTGTTTFNLHLTSALIDGRPITSFDGQTTAPPSEDNLSANDGSIGWVAGPIIGGIIGLTAIFGAAYIIGREKGLRGSPLPRTISMAPSFNENPAFNASSAEQIPDPVGVRSFPAYVNELHKDGNKKFRSQYQVLVKLTTHHEKSVSELPQNRNKNRYANVLPYDFSRVKLAPVDVDQQSTDYINASYIPGQTYQREYIAAQGPLTNTLADFWRMVWEQNVGCIVMLTSLKEDGKDKCAKYWPSKSDVYQDEFLSYGDVQVCLSSESVLNHYVVRVLQVQLDSVSRSIRQYHFLDWMDNSTPHDVENFLNFIRDVRAFSHRSLPILVHCSSGAGRTGTFILVDRMLQVVDGGGELDLFATTLEMRDHRISMVQNETQFIFAHDAIKRAVDEKIFGASHHGFDGFDEMLT